MLSLGIAADNQQKTLRTLLRNCEVINMQDRDFDWFLQNYDELYKQYGKSYLVIKDQNVIGSFQTYADGVRGASLIAAPGSFIVQHCDGTPDAYTITLNV